MQTADVYEGGIKIKKLNCPNEKSCWCSGQFAGWLAPSCAFESLILHIRNKRITRERIPRPVSKSQNEGYQRQQINKMKTERDRGIPRPVLMNQQN